MKKIVLAALVVASLFASCSSEKTFKKKDGSTITAKPYGWASKENKVEGVNYELNAPDVVASIIFAPSVIAPVLLTAYDVWEPVLWYCATLSHDIGFKLSDIGKMNYDKLHSRQLRGKLHGSGDNR